jgi:diguanylate cyclase (GGDEF)-like protein
MTRIDPQTVIVLTGVMGGLMALVMYSLKRNYPTSIKGLAQWSAAFFMLFVAGVLIGGRGVLPEVVTISVANFLLWSGVYVCFVGTQLFYGVTPRIWPWMGLITTALTASLWYSLIQPDYVIRLAWFTALMALLFAVHAWLIIRRATLTFATAMTCTVLVSMTCIQLMRLVTSPQIPPQSGITDNSVYQVIYITSFALVNLLLAIGLVLMATDRLRAELEHLATHDSLTNALTRRHMDEACRIEMERTRRNGRSMALMMMDLDHFKAVNDTHGHQAGDQVLINFVIKINALLRPADQLGRFGGEEFVLLLPETSMEDALQVAERIRALCATGSGSGSGSELGPTCTVSIGVASTLNDRDTVDALLARADAAMYRAKDNGRNRVEAA